MGEEGTRLAPTASPKCLHMEGSLHFGMEDDLLVPGEKQGRLLGEPS